MSDYDLEPTVDDAPAEPETAVEEASAPSAPEAEAWTPPASQAEYEAHLQQAATAAYYEALNATQQQEQYAEYAQPEAPAEPGAQPEWLSEDPELKGYIDQAVQQGIEQGMSERMGEYEPILGLVAEEKGAQLAESYLSNIEGQIGGFDHSHAHAIATGLVEAGAAPAEALYRAALMQRENETALRQQAYQEYQNQLANGQQASAQPGVSGAATELRELGGYDDISEAWLSNGRRPTHAAG
ncbi:MAG: hypothetical protein H0V07_06220 [Propionibacteriales bacterium]|nr:hypothetical protein [Propionibacteriales bacterium]